MSLRTQEACATHAFVTGYDRKRSRGRQDSQPRKKRRIDESAVAEERLQRTALIAMRSHDFWVWSKMKARRLILEEDTSPESRRTARKECPSQEARPAEKAAREKEESIKKKPYPVEDRSTSVEQLQASRRDKGKTILTEDVPLRPRDVPVESTRTEEPRDQVAEVLTVSSDTKEEPVALEEVAAKAVEDLAAAKSGPQKVTSPRTSTDTVILEKGEEPSTEETQSSALGAADVLSVQPMEAKYEAFQRKLSEEVEKRRKAEQVIDNLPEDVERAKCASVDLLKRLEACRTAYDAKSLKIDELQAAAEEKKREYQSELAVRAKKLSEYEATRIANLELIEKLETQSGELRTQRSQAEEQLCEVEAKLAEAEGKNRQFSEETREALTARVERCLRGYVLWQIESHNRLWLRKIEHCAAKLIARSGRRHCQLSKKLESYLTTSRHAVANLEVELVNVLKRLGLERRLEGAATVDSGGVGPVRCSHHSK
ncbi:hypothetical protein AXG93_3884s1000 [Marchantia polymorpha subsp. ruderalis]|uniref:Uncharacterized protein n=1 Tax=Marchantia polymorpha subsp. ruderalis TaxID=1480154 RepID=A0A176W9E9_MARPO|nr:hypothetical protein AXG93_3884s1000 [Marchantia polymorpha subsp. ruderalis]